MRARSRRGGAGASAAVAARAVTGGERAWRWAALAGRGAKERSWRNRSGGREARDAWRRWRQPEGEPPGGGGGPVGEAEELRVFRGRERRKV